MRKSGSRRTVRRQIGQFPTSVRVQKQNGSDVFFIQAGHNHILHDGRPRREDFGFQDTNVYPGARRKFEIFGNTSVKQQALAGVGFVHKPHRIARFIIALGIKGRNGSFRIAPIAGRYIGGAVTNFELIAIADQFYGHTRYRYAQQPRVAPRPVGKQGRWT